MASNFSVLFAHGSYHTPAHYHAFLQQLQSLGVHTACPQLPTSDLSKLNVGDVNNPDFNREPPPGGYPDSKEDAEILQRELDTLVLEQQRDVLLVAHSSGGMSATQAAQPRYQRDVREAQGKKGGVVGIFYVGAFVIPVGESVTSFFQPKEGTFVTPPFVQFHEWKKNGPQGLATPKDAPAYLFNDLPTDKAEQWSATLTASPILRTMLDNDVYSALPCAYLVLDNDQTLPSSYQTGMVQGQEQRGGVKFTVYHAPAGHSPHLSWTEELARTVVEYYGKIVDED